MSWWSRFVNVTRADRMTRELEEEQRFHIDARADDLVAQGMTREAAAIQAERRFGPRLLMREASLDVKLLNWLESLWRDTHLGLRLLRKDAIVSSAAIISLGLAIGACTAAFALIDALMLRDLPVRDPSTLVVLDRDRKDNEIRLTALCSYPLLDRIRQTTTAQMDVFSMSHQSLRQAILPDAGGVEEKVGTQFVSGNAFDLLGVTPALGRLLTPADDRTPGAHQTAVISHAFWTRRFGADPRIVGQWMRIEQRPYQIIGVAQAGFSGVHPGVMTDVWLPNMMFGAESLKSPNWNWLQVWGRLKPGVTREAASPVVQASFSNFVLEQPDSQANPSLKDPKAREAALAIVLRDASAGLSQVRQMFERPLIALAMIAGCVLLIACSNVANLLLARGAARAREMALRASIGAGRARLLQQVLVESSVLTAAATALGILCAVVAARLIVGLISTDDHPIYVDARLDWRVLAFVAALGCLTTILFGLVPAIRAAGAGGGAGSGAGGGITSLAGGRAHTMHSGVVRPLVALQIGFSVMVLFVAALLLRSFDRLLHVDLGFNPDRVTVLSIESRERLEDDRAREVGRQLVERVRSLSGVEHASMSGWAPFKGWSWGNGVTIPGRGHVGSLRLAVSSDFFKTMGARIVDGREFAAHESDATRPMPIVVNAAFARKYFPNDRAVGQRVSSRSRNETVPIDIVGVVDNVRDGSIREPVGPYIFSPIGDASGAVIVRSPLEPRTLADRVREELPRVHPALRLVDVTPQATLVNNALLRERLLAVLSGFFAALGLALAAVGLYGVSSYAVVRRTREIGIRLTLGARSAAVVRSVLGRLAAAVGIGVIAGLAGGVYFARFVRTLLFEIEPISPWGFALPVLCLLAVALAAAWPPARRATRVDPAEALRSE